MGTQNMTPNAVTEAAGAGTGNIHYVDWGAIIAGTILATAISTLLFTFGTGIGLSMVSPYEGEGVSKNVYFIALALWTLWVVVSSFIAGGYIAGRMRHRIGDGDRHEVEVRDGIHGLSVWALGTVLASLLLASGVSGAVAGGAKLAAPAVAEAGKAAAASPTVDALFRRAVQPAGTQTSGQTPGQTPGQSAAVADGGMDATSPNASAPGNADADRGEVGRLLATNMVRSELNATDRTYVAGLIAQNTGMTQAEAEQRVTSVIAEAKQKADAARKLGVLTAFAAAVALLVAGAAAVWAATLGGRHRDEATDTSSFWRWT